MYLFTLEVVASTASFRIPEQHTFQPTLPLPPVTTLTGLMGAALGLPFDAALTYRKKHGVAFGIVGTHKGEMRDLWKYEKIKAGEALRDVVMREYLTDFAATVVVGTNDEEVTHSLESAFRDPAYALTMGTSDDLLKVRRISQLVERTPRLCADFAYTVLSGDKTASYEPTIDLRTTPITYDIRAPQVFLVPTDFVFTNGTRRISARASFTFVGSPIRLAKPVEAYDVDDVTCELL